MFATFRADLARASAAGHSHQSAPRSRRRTLKTLVDKQEVWAIGEFRLRQSVARLPTPFRVCLHPFLWLSRHAIECGTGIYLPTTAQIGPGLVLVHIGPVIVHGDTVAGENLTLSHQTTLGSHRGGTPRIGDGVFIGPGARVLGAVEIGDGARIGANAVVTIDVPAGHVAHGPSSTTRPAESKHWLIGYQPTLEQQP